MSRSSSGNRVYVGGLVDSVRKEDLRKEFSKFCQYGTIKSVWVACNLPRFAHLEFDDDRDAKEAVRAMNGQDMGGSCLRVEFSHNGGQRDSRGREVGKMSRGSGTKSNSEEPDRYEKAKSLAENTHYLLFGQRFRDYMRVAEELMSIKKKIKKAQNAVTRNKLLKYIEEDDGWRRILEIILGANEYRNDFRTPDAILSNIDDILKFLSKLQEINLIAFTKSNQQMVERRLVKRRYVYV